MKVTFVVPGEPCGQPRVKATRRGNHAGVYTPMTVKDPKGGTKPHPAAVFKAGIQAAWPSEELPVFGPVSMYIEAVFSRSSAKQWKKKAMTTYPHTGKPDADNIAKAVMDSLNGLAYNDDSQVSWLAVYKRVAAGNELPRTVVTVMPYDEDELNTPEYVP